MKKEGKIIFAYQLCNFGGRTKVGSRQRCKRHHIKIGWITSIYDQIPGAIHQEDTISTSSEQIFIEDGDDTVDGFFGKYQIHKHPVSQSPSLPQGSNLEVCF